MLYQGYEELALAVVELAIKDKAVDKMHPAWWEFWCDAARLNPVALRDLLVRRELLGTNA